LGNYRKRLDIIADILGVINHGAKKTQVMYRANLSYKLLSKYLTEVIGFGLVYFETAKECYQITHKGRSFLEAYKEYHRRNKHVEEQLNNMKGKRKLLEELCSSE
jgi:predicted transcriptional regulator